MTLGAVLGLLLAVLGWLPLVKNNPTPVAAAEQQVEPLAGLPVLPASEVILGKASWYGPGFDGKSTANGERFNQWS